MKRPHICSIGDLPVYQRLEIINGNRAYRIQREVTMNRILKMGTDAHSTNYTLCAMEPVIGADTIRYIYRQKMTIP